MIFTFINKLDREARDPFELLDELIESKKIDGVEGWHQSADEEKKEKLLEKNNDKINRRIARLEAKIEKGGKVFEIQLYEDFVEDSFSIIEAFNNFNKENMYNSDNNNNSPFSYPICLKRQLL